MQPLTLTPKSREVFLSDRFAIQPEETSLVFSEELVRLLLSEESLKRQVIQLTQKVELLQSLLDSKPQLIKLYA